MKKILLLVCFYFMMSKMAIAQNNLISLDLKDAPVKATLEMAFKQAGIKNYVIDNEVSGFVTMTITEQPFENSLKLIMRATSIPLTYVKENDIYIVKVRKVTELKPTPLPELTSDTSINSVIFERIPLNYIDPLDLVSAFGNILYIRQFTRYGGNSGGFGMGGGMMGQNGGFGGMGGMNGMGGGMMGGMGSLGGGLGNGLMGGMGGFGGLGGGRNF